MVLDVHNHAKQINLLESWFVDRDLILAGMNAGEDIDSCIIRCCGRDRSAVHTLKLDLRPRHDATRFVCNQA